jgi:Putative collagen-binding domain of a collagenase
VHHFAFVDAANSNNLTPHLWMGAVVPGFASMHDAQWRSLVDTRASQHFNHLGVTLVDESVAANFKSPEFFRAAEAKLRYANDKNIIVDIAFFGPDGLMDRLLPAHGDRENWFTYAVSRLAAFDVTWQGIEGWETYTDGRALLREIAEYLAKFDPYKRTRSSRTNSSSGPLVDDGWLRYRSYQTSDDSIGAIDQQVYQFPSVNNFADSATDADTFRHRLWNATMNGQYPDAVIPNEQAANEMKIWYEFMEGTRHWELEPFFDVDNGRGLALGEVEYIIYVEKPAPVTVRLDPQGYDCRWFNPATGQSIKMKEVKSPVFTAEPPDRTHDWVLQISREGHKASMLKSYKFDSREQGIIMQEVEGNPEKVPFDVVQPLAGDIALSSPGVYAIKLISDKKAMQHMMYEWTGEVTTDNRSYRVIGTGPGGTFRIPANIAKDYPAALHVHILGMNALGKVYALDRNYTLTK